MVKEKMKKTEIGEIPESWNIIKIKETGRIVTGSTPSTKNKNFYGGEYNLISPADLDNGKYVQSAHKKLTKAGYQTCTPIPQNSILVGCIGNIGKLGMVNNNYSTTNQQINSIIVNSSHDSNFVYYMLKNCRQRLSQSATQVTVPILNKNNFENFKVAIPSLFEQKAIAEVLGSLDDKIDLLHRQNKTLEDTAQTLFRKWFIEDADEGWEKKPLSYFGNIICGKTPSKKVKEYFGGHIPFIKIPDMHGKTFVFRSSDTLSKEGRDSQKNAIIPPKSICISCIATVGLVSMNAFESQTNQQINSVIPKKDEYRYYIYLFMKSSTTLLKAMASGGTATMNLNTRNFSEILLPVPSSNKIFTFHVKVKSLFDKMFSNQSQMRDIERLRDTLLPKLVNGKVRVN